MGTPYLKIGHRQWFTVNCSLMLYYWTGSEWRFTGTAKRVSK